VIVPFQIERGITQSLPVLAGKDPGAASSFVPTIGPLFLLNAIGSFIAGLLLLAPIERVLRGRLGDLFVGLLARTGIAIAAPPR
jgi:hypothetical protein